MPAYSQQSMVHDIKGLAADKQTTRDKAISGHRRAGYSWLISFGRSEGIFPRATFNTVKIAVQKRERAVMKARDRI